MGKAIVATVLGAEGLEFPDGDEIALVDDPRRFALAVADLLSTPRRRERLGHAARLWVVKNYSLERFQTALREAVSRR
jgi:glycosyltransferase involved in cell wall biosynthesis